MGETVTFVSEKQLAAGNAPQVRAIVFPHATHVSNAARNGLMHFHEAGGQYIFAGEGCVAFDEYHRPRETNPTSQVSLKSERAAAADLRKVLKPPTRLSLIDSATSEPTWGIEYKMVEHGQQFLVPMINFLKQPQTVDIVFEHAEGEAVDLLTGEIVSLKKLKLDPMIPMLLKISWRG
jgi:hypothetical protein